MWPPGIARGQRVRWLGVRWRLSWRRWASNCSCQIMVSALLSAI
ncbi:hypothetical protein HMPREF1980_00855 [Actinomyces sp. oral taxon 172 str. F0311]|nr:hypothetical protein HMPREF1980_00855 [Actinomyces sp. oral taxon 172 str. F0311]